MQTKTHDLSDLDDLIVGTTSKPKAKRSKSDQRTPRSRKDSISSANRSMQVVGRALSNTTSDSTHPATDGDFDVVVTKMGTGWASAQIVLLRGHIDAIRSYDNVPAMDKSPVTDGGAKCLDRVAFMARGLNHAIARAEAKSSKSKSK